MKVTYELVEKGNEGIIIKAENEHSQFATLCIEGHEYKINVYEVLVTLKEIYGE